MVGLNPDNLTLYLHFALPLCSTSFLRKGMNMGEINIVKAMIYIGER